MNVGVCAWFLMNIYVFSFACICISLSLCVWRALEVPEWLADRAECLGFRCVCERERETATVTERARMCVCV